MPVEVTVFTRVLSKYMYICSVCVCIIYVHVLSRVHNYVLLVLHLCTCVHVISSFPYFVHYNLFFTFSICYMYLTYSSLSHPFSFSSLISSFSLPHSLPLSPSLSFPHSLSLPLSPPPPFPCLPPSLSLSSSQCIS